MVKGRTQPSVDLESVTGCAVVGKPDLCVIGIGGSNVVFHVTGITFCWRGFIPSVAVALDTIDSLVPADEWVGRVVESSASPHSGTRMTKLAIRREIGSLVVWIFSGSKLIRVTFGTSGRGASKRAGVMALSAVQTAMPALQGKTRHHVVGPSPNLNLSPRLRRMAVFAMGAELKSIRVVLLSIPMAGLTTGWRSPDDSP